MNEPFQPLSRLLPFSSSPGGWKEWENFWEDFLNSSPFLPYPSKQTVFKRVTFAKKYGVAGGKQDGIDIEAEMDDGSILAVQCKDIQRYEPSKGISAMTKAEKEFPEADAYFLVLTQEGVPKRLEREAERRGNWFVIGLSALSSWFFSGKFIDPEGQKELVLKHFGKAHLRALFPIPEDDFFVSPSQFFAKRNFISHEASLAGEEFQALRDRIASSASGNGARVSIVIAPGGGGKTRLLKAVADSLAAVSPERKVRFQSDTANAQAEDYSIRGDMFLNSSTFIDDAHRLENVKPAVLRRIAESTGATIVIGVRPNSLESLKVIMLAAGFVEDDWECDHLPSLNFKSRCAIARELAPEVGDEVIHWLAEQSKDCVLVCTAGAELIKAGKFPDELIGTDDFKRKVFDHLLNSSLDGLYHGNLESLKRGELVIRILAMLGTIEDSELLNEKISEVIRCEPWDIDRIRHDLTTSGLLRVSRGRIRVIPDLLSDHLVYETGYGDCNERLPTLVKKVIDVFGTVAAGTLFGNLAEAEWRANQAGKRGSFLDPLWEKIREIFSDPENMKTFGLLDEWEKFAAFQPERTLKLAEIILAHEDLRIRSDISPKIHRGFRYDSISLQVGKLPDLLLPVLLHHPEQRMEALDMLWRVGQVKEGMVNDEKELPIAWKRMIQAGSMVYWREGGPKDLFHWLKKWVATQEGHESLSNGHPFLSAVAAQWFRKKYARSVKEENTIRNFSSEIGGFQKEILEWLQDELVPKGVGHALVVARVLFANTARPVMPSADPVSSLMPNFRKGLEILSGILSKYDKPLLRLIVWRYLSHEGTRAEGKARIEIEAVRNSISRDVAFELARLASGYAANEWNLEWMDAEKPDVASSEIGDWWQERASETVSKLRVEYPSVGDSLNLIDELGDSLKKFREHCSWDTVAYCWANSFPGERNIVVEDFFSKPCRNLTDCLGYFVAGGDELESSRSVRLLIKSLNHRDSKIRRAILRRLAWRDVPLLKEVARKFESMAASEDPEVLSDIVNFVSWIRYEGGVYLETILGSLRIDMLTNEDLAKLTAAIYSFAEHGKKKISPNLLASLFKRFEDDDSFELQRLVPDYVAQVLHRAYPVEMFRIHLQRIRNGRGALWFGDLELGGWTLEQIFPHPDFKDLAEELLTEALNAESCDFYALRTLFDSAVGRVDPQLASGLLERHLNDNKLKQVVDLTGCGNGSLVYEAPEFTKALLLKIAQLPAKNARELRERLTRNAEPSMWGWCNGEVEQEFLWARDLSLAKSEEFRSDPILHSFYRSILRNQEQRIAATRLEHEEAN